jgi:two-component system nitrogen regulation response regulator GlnG/two-component system response regulator HydG
LDIGSRGSRGLQLVRSGRGSVTLNGVRELGPGESADVESGDTVLVGQALLLLVAERPATLEPMRFHRPDPAPAFGDPDADGIVGESPAAWDLRDQISFAASMSQHVAIFGPTGSGKELTARGVHRQSPRGQRPIVAHSAADLPPSLFEVELFGNRPNYPNPQTPGREGLIGMANGSSLFLDEIALLPLELQGKLLRVLDDEGSFRRLGVDEPARSDFRLIAATNRPPDSLQSDLLARLKIRVEVPGLSERPEDIPLLVNHLLRGMTRSSAEANLVERFTGDGVEGAAGVRIDPRLLEQWVRGEHPLNLRGLESELLRALAQSRGRRIEAPAAPASSPARPEPARASAARGSLDELGSDELRGRLEEAGWNVSLAARRLGCSRFQLHRQIRLLGLKPPA